MIKLSKQEMIKIAKRMLKPEYHVNMRVEVKHAVDDKGFPFSFRAVCYLEDNFIGENVLKMNA